MNSEMYRMEFLDIYKNPKNFGEVAGCTHMYTESSPICGDEITFELKVADEKVIDAKFSGKGCVISFVSSELLIEKIIGMKIDEVKKLTSEDVLKLIGVDLTISRTKCALVSLGALRGAIC